MIKSCTICTSPVDDTNGYGIYWLNKDNVYYQPLFGRESGYLCLCTTTESDCKKFICEGCIQELYMDYDTIRANR